MLYSAELRGHYEIVSISVDAYHPCTTLDLSECGILLLFIIKQLFYKTLSL